MKREFRSFFALSLIALSSAAIPAMAESGTIRITVPFAFTAGAATLPAGNYVIYEEADNRVLMIQGKGGSAILFTTPSSIADASAASNVTFKRTENGARLTGVQLSGLPGTVVNASTRPTK
jgi:hypothetical protein